MSDESHGIDPFGSLEISSAREGERHVIALAGELDIAGVDRVTRELRRAEATDAREIVLDLSGVQFIDSSGVRLIVEAETRSRADGGRLVLIRGSRAVQRVFELTGLAERLPFAP